MAVVASYYTRLRPDISLTTRHHPLSLPPRLPPSRECFTPLHATLSEAVASSLTARTISIDTWLPDPELAIYVSASSAYRRFSRWNTTSKRGRYVFNEGHACPPTSVVFSVNTTTTRALPFLSAQGTNSPSTSSNGSRRPSHHRRSHLLTSDGDPLLSDPQRRHQRRPALKGIKSSSASTSQNKPKHARQRTGSLRNSSDLGTSVPY
jgi:hypothetical protein